MGKPLTPDKLFALRRLRKARRLFKQQPVFAFAILCEEYKGYTHEQFLDDLRIRKKPKPKKKKSPLTRYGRYYEMNRLLELYNRTGQMDYARQALQLRSVLTKPYRVWVRIEGKSFTYRLSPLIPYKEVEKLNINLSSCKNESEVDEMIDRFREANRIN